MADIAVLFRSGPHALATTTRYAIKCSDIAVQVTKTPIQIPMPQLAPELIDIGMFRPSITLSGLLDGGSVNTNTSKAGGDAVTDFEGMEVVPHTNGHFATTLTAASGTDAVCSVTSTDGFQIGYDIKIGSDTRTISAIYTNPESATNAGNLTVTSNFSTDHASGSVVEHEGQTLNYYIPYKNKLENKVYTLVKSGTVDLEMEIGAAEHHELITHTHDSSTHTHESTGGGIYKVAIQQARFGLNAAKEDRWDFSMQLVCKSRNGSI